jgi:hypothetical protein
MESVPEGEDRDTRLSESRQFFVCSRSDASEKSWSVVAIVLEDRQLANRLPGAQIKPGPNGSVAA